MSTALTLYEIEDRLAALLDSAELVPDEQDAEFEMELAEQFRLAADKRESCGRFLKVCEAQVNACNAEIERLKDRRDRIEGAVERMRQIIARVIEKQGTDERGVYRRLEGHTFTFSLRRTPASVVIEDEAEVPARFKRVNVVIDKRAVRTALDAGESVPGADLSLGGLTLQVR